MALVAALALAPVCVHAQSVADLRNLSIGELANIDVSSVTKTAQARKTGLVEAADGGTLFLDEIGEMPIELQSKLLRFLQDKRFSPLGSTRVIEADVRVVAATSRVALEKDKPPLNLKSAQWLPVYLIGMGIISWQGGFGSGENHIKLWYDILIVAAFSLVIYFWAVSSRLPREEMLAYVGKVDVVEDPQGLG